MTEARKRNVHLAGLLLGASFLVSGLLFVVLSWGAFRTDKAIEKTGESALGRVVGKEVVFDSEGDSDYVLETRFSPAEGEEMIVRQVLGIDAIR